MHEESVEIAGLDGAIPCFIAAPDVPAPAVILYMDAPGMREELRDFARRLAGAGYLCLLPDMYYRLGQIRLDLPRRDERMTAVIQAAKASLDLERVRRDSGAMLDFLERHPRAAKGPVGVIGYCMSGCFVVDAAGHFPARIGAAAALHGVEIVTDRPDSPHLLADRIDAELYFGFASDDPLVPDDVIPTLRETLKEKAVEHLIEAHPETQHGFSFPARPVYHEAAAEACWARIFEMFERRLKGRGVA